MSIVGSGSMGNEKVHDENLLEKTDSYASIITIIITITIDQPVFVMFTFLYTYFQKVMTNPRSKHYHASFTDVDTEAQSYISSKLHI